MTRFLLIAGFAESLINFRGPLIAALQAKGLQVHVAAPLLSIDQPTRLLLEAQGFTVHRIPLRRSGTNLFFDLYTLLSLFRLMRRVRPHWVLGYTIKPVIYGSLAASLVGVPNRYALITGLGYAFQGDGQRRSLQALVQRLYTIGLSQVHKVFFQNPDDEALFRKLDILAPAKSSVVVNGSGVDVASYTVQPLPQGTPRFLLIARLLGDKGVREYAAAAALVRTRHPHARFDLVGWIDSNPDAIKQAELDGWVAQGHINFRGKLVDVRPAIGDCSVYVLPSYREGTPRTVLEAMAMGRPVITTDAPGCRETVVDGVNGFLVPVKSVGALADAMQRFIEDSSLVTRMGRCARQIAEQKYDVHKVNDVMLNEMGLANKLYAAPRLLLVTTVPETLSNILIHQPRYLAENFQVSLATSPGESLKQVAQNEGLEIFQVPMVRGINLLRDLMSVARMIQVIRASRPDMVHSYTPKAGLVGMLAAWFCRVPVRVHTFTGLIFPTSDAFKKKLLILVDRFICALATHIVPEGEGVKKDLQRFCITRKPLHVIGHGNIAGVDSVYFSPLASGIEEAALQLRLSSGIGEDCFLFCYVGRLNKDKGLAELMGAFNAMPATAHLLLVGGLDYSAPPDAATVAAIEAHSRVHSFGFVDDIRPALQAADVLVLPSYREGFPNAVLQAGAMALPVIATDINGSNEVIEPGYNGWLVPARDKKALTDAMRQALQSPASALAAMGQRARARIQQRFERQQHWKRMADFYQALWNQHQTHKK